MALQARDEIHANQISAGTQGRIKGHQFEAEVTKELNELDLSQIDYLVSMTKANIYEGNPAAALIEHISKDKNKQISRLKAYWLGGLATAGEGAELKNDAGEVITGSKSDVVMDLEYSDGEKDCVGVSVKSCKNNAQLALTTSNAFCEMLRSNDIEVSNEAEVGLKMFCGENGYSPKDGYEPSDKTNIPNPRNARPERWYWEELATPIQKEWASLLSTYQDEITILLLQKANAYKTDKFKPTYILHECVPHTDIQNCHMAVLSMNEFAAYSRKFDSFGLKSKRVSKGRYKGIDLAEHQYPHFGFIQFQPIGNKQNFSELQFNLKSNYYNKFENLKDVE